MTFLARRIDCAWIVDFHSKMVSNGLNTAASQIRRVCKIAPRGQCATARRDFAHAAGREPRGCTPYTAAQPKGRASQSSSPLIGVDRPRERARITRSVGQNLTQCMVRPCVAREFRRSVGIAVLHQCIRPLIGAVAPGHHGCQRACGLITGQASNEPFGSPGFACAGKTGPPSRLILSQTSAGKRDYVIAFSLSVAVPLFVL